MWCEKLFRTIIRDVFDMGELKKLETEETVKVEETNRSLDKSLFNIMYEPINIKDRYYPNL